MLTFGPLTAFNERTSQPLPGTPIQVFTLDGAAVDTFTLDGAPLTLVSNARGYVGMFQADTTERVLVARARGGNDQPVYAHETLDEAAGLAEIVESGRLSEASLMSTFASKATEPTVTTTAGTRVTIGGFVVFYDSGWRELPAPPRLTTGRILVRRTLHDAVLRFEEVAFSDITPTTSLEFLTDSGFIPAGFRPMQYQDRTESVIRGVYTNYASRIGISQNTRLLYIENAASLPIADGNGRGSGEIRYTTTPALPTALPGTPA